MTHVRAPKEDILSNPIHNLPFLDWVREQTESIEKFSNILVSLEGGQGAVSMSKITEALARYTYFYTVQTSFYQIYKKGYQDKKEIMNVMFDTIYMEVKGWVTDPSTDIGKKYIKKAATQEEIRKESCNHSDWQKYIDLGKEVQELELKCSAQKRYLDVIAKYDTILQVLKKRDEKEIKFLYLEQ